MNIGSAEQKTLAALKNLSAEGRVEAAKIVGTAIVHTILR